MFTILDPGPHAIREVVAVVEASHEQRMREDGVDHGHREGAELVLHRDAPPQLRRYDVHEDAEYEDEFWVVEKRFAARVDVSDLVRARAALADLAVPAGAGHDVEAPRWLRM